MLAARIYQAKELRVVTIPPPELNGDDQVRVRIFAAGICGSDLHVYQTGDYLTRTPITMGHEFAGKVTAVGKNVRHFAPGDHVVGDSRVWCDNCLYCSGKQFNLCDKLGFLGEVCEGAFTEEIVVPARNLVKIDAAVPGHIAALAEPLAVALHAIGQSRALSDAGRILILGAGPIGALVHAVLRLQGHRDLTVADTSAYRRGLLESVDGSSRITADPEGTYDLVFETTGAGAVVENVLPRCLRKGAQAVFVGLFAKKNLFNFTDMVEKEWQLNGCSCFDSELTAAVDLLENHGDAFAHVVSHQFPVARAQEAFDLLLAPEKAGMKIMLIPDDER